MSERNVFETIQDYAEKQELKLELTDDAKKLAKQLYGAQPKKRRMMRMKWLRVLSYVLLPCMLITAIVLPFALRDKNLAEKPRYFSSEDMQSDRISSVAEFMAESNLTAQYFTLDGASGESVRYSTKNTDELMFLKQSLLVFGEDYFDVLDFFIVFSGDEFEEFNEYRELDSQLQYNDIQVNYKEEFLDNNFITRAYFSDNHIKYYMKITAASAEKLNFYLEKLYA